MSLSAATVWEIRPGVGSVNNGGGFVTGATGSDFSQQISPQYALTGVTSSGAGATVLSASAAADMVGNIAKGVSGTNLTVGWYQVVSVVVGVSITFDANIASGVMASGVINIGGATNSLDSIYNVIVAGNIVWVKKGSDALTGNRSFTTGSISLPVFIIGYNSVRSDLTDCPPANVHLVTGFLDTTNFPSLSITGGRFGMDSYTYIQAISFTGTSNASMIFSFGGFGTINFFRCAFNNSNTGANSCVLDAGSVAVAAQDCDFACAGSTKNTLNGLGPTELDGCRVTSTSSNAMDIGANSVVINSLIYNLASNKTGILCSTTALMRIENNTFATIPGTCVSFPNSAQSNTKYTFAGNKISNCGTGVNNLRSGTTKMPLLGGNNQWWGTTTPYTGFANIADGTGYLPGDITTGTNSDYVNNGSNFRPSATDHGIGLNLPYGSTIGAFQRYPALPTAADVRSGTKYGQDNTTVNTFDERTGTLAVPSAANVLFGVSVDNTTGTYVTVATSDVRSGVTFGAGSVSTGVLVLPATTDVKNGVQFGTNGTEFTGSLAAGGNLASNRLIGG